MVQRLIGTAGWRAMPQQRSSPFVVLSLRALCLRVYVCVGTHFSAKGVECGDMKLPFLKCKQSDLGKHVPSWTLGPGTECQRVQSAKGSKTIGKMRKQ